MKGNRLLIDTIEVPIDENLSMEWFSPYIDPNEVVIGSTSVNPKGKFSMPFEALGNEKLNKALGFLNIPTLRSRIFKVDNVRLLSDGYNLQTGYVQVSNVGVNLNTGISNYKATVFFEQSRFADVIGEKKVSELALNGIKLIPKNPIGKNIYPFAGYKGKADFEIVRGLHPEYGYTFVKVNARIADALGFFFNFNQHEKGISTAPLTQNPYPYEAICATSVWAADVVNGVHDSDYICFPSFWAHKNDEPMLCNHWEDAKNRFYTFRFVKEDAEFVTARDGGDVRKSLVAELEIFDNPLVPCYYYHQVLRHCFSEHGYELQGDSFIDTDHFKRLYLLNTYSIKNISQFILSDFDNSKTVTPFFIEESSEVNPKNHLPGMTINEFLKNFMLRFSCRFVFDGNKVSIEYNNLEKIQREIVDYDPEVEFEKRESGLKIAFDTSVDAVYDWLDTVSWSGIKAFKEASFGDAKTDITIKIPPVLNEAHDLLFYTPETTNGYLEDKSAIAVHLPSTKNPITGYAYPSSYVFQVVWVRLDGTYPDGTEKYWDQIKYIDCDEQEPISPNNGYNALAFDYGLKTQYPGTANELRLPFSGPFEWLAHDSSTMLGTWNLSLNMEKGIIPVFLRLWINLYLCPEKLILHVGENFDDILAHKWNETILWRGLQLYLLANYFELPITKMPKYECIRIERI